MLQTLVGTTLVFGANPLAVVKLYALGLFFFQKPSGGSRDTKETMASMTREGLETCREALDGRAQELKSPLV